MIKNICLLSIEPIEKIKIKKKRPGFAQLKVKVVDECGLLNFKCGQSPAISSRFEDSAFPTGLEC